MRLFFYWERILFQFRVKLRLIKAVLVSLFASYEIVTLGGKKRLSHFRYFPGTPGMIYVDVGASIGGLCKEAWQNMGKMGGRKIWIVAIEPDPEAFKELTKNLSELPNIDFVQKACWHTREKVKLYATQSLKHGRLLPWPYGGIQYSRVCEVEGDTLDNILEEVGIKEADFVKIDVEGLETDVLRGFTRFKRGTIFHIEYHNNRSAVIDELKKKEIRILRIEQWREQKYEHGWDFGAIHAIA